jgi:hypothetical protein
MTCSKCKKEFKEGDTLFSVDEVKMSSPTVLEVKRLGVHHLCQDCVNKIYEVSE